ncbi:pyruvate formate lyase-activating enzyme 1 [Psychromonas sp. CNPT3]|uniref:pyruvate formate lyase 1-activating protein n=1 Tax=Psychromonas sp. CNPT3 TaxID=314282 RepID=UPI00006E7652|nr:pyruvate formate lyase 1-activating protein [Psychromonas sp. CNPT3]AGH80338.1 pyruvate formate lyase-activating enzyme 1 [Psychromonas sp. CNPT3]
MSVMGHVHSIETCGAVDGPGIRFIIFLQGCLMRCKYCHNRDTWALDGGKEMSVEELMTEIVQYRNYMQASGGGITISGGEAMLQPEFVKAMFEACRLEGIHTCLDTNGFVRRIDDTTKAVLELSDLVLLDIKQIDDHKHIDLTHVSNKYTLTFAKYLAEMNQPVYLRYVIVPGYTDALEDAHALGKFIAPMKNIEKIELLPYHDLGRHKWIAMGESYPLEGVDSPSKQTMDTIKNILLEYNDCVIY